MENNPPPDNNPVDPPDPPGQPYDPSLDEDYRTLKLLSFDVDRFIASLTSISDKPNSPSPNIPENTQTYSSTVEAVLQRYDDPSSLASNSVLVDSIGRVGKVSCLLSQFSPDYRTAPWLADTSVFLQHAMVSLEDELRNILEEFTTFSDSPTSSNPATSPTDKTPKSLSSKRFHLHRHQDSSDTSGSHHFHHRTSSGNSIGSLDQPEHYPTEEDDYPAIPYDSVAQMRVMVSAMVASGYETECFQVYCVQRRNSFKSAMKRRGFRKLSIDEVGKMSWEQLESQIATWNRVVRHTSRVLYPREYKLCTEVFLENVPIRDTIMTSLARAVVILFLNFAEAVAMTKRASDRLFKVLETYESLTELESAVEGGSCATDVSKETRVELQAEISAVQQRLGEAAIAFFSDLKDSIRNDPTKNTASSGGVHPLTRYTMNYLRLACEFKDALEAIFEKSSDGGGGNKMRSPLAAELVRIMGMLDVNLEAKSKQYKDASLRCVFLMNNGRFILQKVKESSEMHELVGRVASRKRSGELRVHHKTYQRETWGKVLQCLNHEGLQVNGKVHKPILKERFKSFNGFLEDIHKTQGSWVVSDEQLQSELRVSVSSVMIPAYRSFVARFGQYFSSGRQTEKYIKFQPEDVEATIEGLFDGNPNSVGKSKK